MSGHNRTVDTRHPRPGPEALLASLSPLVGVRLVTTPVPPDPSLPGDFLLRMGTRPPLTLLVALKNAPSLSAAQARDFILAAKPRVKSPHLSGVLLFAPWISDALAAELRKAGLFYADLAGNAFLKFGRPSLLVDVRGRRPEKRPGAELGRLIEPSGLKVIHLLLSDASTGTLPVRPLADRAGVSRASVSIVLRALRQAGHLVSGTEGRLGIRDRAALLDLFIRGYALKLRPELFLGTYRHRTADPGKLLEDISRHLNNTGGRWALTGGVAAGLLTRHLKSPEVALFVDPAAEAALQKEPLLPDSQGGNIILFRLFAPGVYNPLIPNSRFPLATPLLVYAELLHDGRPREIETAELLRPQILNPEVSHGSQAR